MLELELLGQFLTERPAPIRVDIPEQAGRAVPLVLPARVVEDRVKTDPLDRHPSLARRRNLMAYYPQPSRTRGALNARLGHEQRLSVALVEGPEQVAEGSILRVINRDRQVAVDPLIVEVVVQPNDVDVLRPAAQLGTKA